MASPSASDSSESDSGSEFSLSDSDLSDNESDAEILPYRFEPEVDVAAGLRPADEEEEPADDANRELEENRLGNNLW